MDLVLLDRHHELPRGERVRLRLPRVSDRGRLHELLGELGLQVADGLDLRRALRLAAGRRVALCATTWDHGGERLVGFAAADLQSGRTTVLADEAAAPGVRRLLEGALPELARPWRRRVA